jgi:diguanylate cyclase (GGDEF)-like protein
MVINLQGIDADYSDLLQQDQPLPIKKMKRSRVFILVSIAIALIDGILVYSNNIMAARTLDRTLEEEGNRLQSSFNLIIDRTYSNMLGMATFIANNPDVVDLFDLGIQAAREEGGGAGGPKTAELRNRLNQEVEQSWHQVQRNFDVRQLHFHFGEDITSFLRVHSPDKFGDDLKDIRFTLVDTFNERKSRVGFETGRVYAGLRGALPLFSTDKESGEEKFLGTLEVGTSFATTLDIIDDRLGRGVGVLLRRDHVNDTMWPDFVEKRFPEKLDFCSCVIEAESREGLRDVINIAANQGVNILENGTDVFEMDDAYYTITRFGLRDYLGDRDADRADVGTIVFWADANEQIKAHHRGQLFNVIFGFAAFLLIEVIIYLGFRFALVRLEQEVAIKTRELSEKAVELEQLSITDRLTALYNRLKLDETFVTEIERAKRYNTPLSVIILDVDHFKSVNDTYGHQIGDRLLVELADILRVNIRSSDFPGRWGGEEFLVICPQTDLDGVKAVAEKLRAAIASHDFPSVGNKTSSFGVATYQIGESADELMARADAALYRAKENGRNRVEVG